MPHFKSSLTLELFSMAHNTNISSDHSIEDIENIWQINSILYIFDQIFDYKIFG